MATRFFPQGITNNKQSPLRTGYETGSGLPDLFIPPVGLVDVDRALFRLFKDEIMPMVADKGSGVAKRVPIIVATAEKWVMIKKKRGVRDRNDTLIIPLITVVRTDMGQDPTLDVTGRGINQQTGEMLIRRKLDKSDRSYQALINRFLLRNQPNVAVPSVTSSSEALTSEAPIGELSNADDIKQGGAYLKSDVSNNVIETIVVPAPQFYTIKYEVTIWTQYVQHTNQIIEKIIGSYLPQGQCWRLETPSGYWFVASVTDGVFTPENNLDDMSTEERFLKHKFEVVVPAYLFVPASPGAPIPIKRYVSSPIIKFETDVTVVASPVNDTDDSDPTRLSSTVLAPSNVKAVSRNRSGETVFTGASLGGLEIAIVDK